MNRICPHCGHARNASTNVPDWQCPACEKAYSKAGGCQPAATFRPAGVAPSRGGHGKWLLLIALLGAAFWFGQPFFEQRPAEAASRPAASQPEVHLYATEWCGYCKATRAFFAANGIRYTEHDIEKSSDALLMHRKLGGNGVPLVVIGDEVIRGYNEAHMRELLRRWLTG